MAAVTKVGNPSYSSVAPPPNDRIGELKCGEDLGAGDACLVKADGLVWRSTGAAADNNARIDGYAADNYYVAQNEAVTLVDNCVWGYGSGLTPGPVFLSAATAGRLSTTATTGGTAPCGKILDSQRIRLWSTRY